MKLLLLLVTFLSSMSLLATPFSNEQYAQFSLSKLPNSAKNAIFKALDSADYYDHDHFAKKRWMMVVDFTQNSSKKRGYLLDLKRYKITTYLVSHGENSGDGRGNVVDFSNLVDSHKSSYGLYITAESYRGKHGKSLRLKGLDSSNDRAYERAIVIHSAKYVSQSMIAKNGFIGTSWGCPALAESVYKKVIRKLKRKSFYYIYHERFSNL